MLSVKTDHPAKAVQVACPVPSRPSGDPEHLGEVELLRDQIEQGRKVFDAPLGTPDDGHRKDEREVQTPPLQPRLSVTLDPSCLAVRVVGAPHRTALVQKR